MNVGVFFGSPRLLALAGRFTPFRFSSAKSAALLTFAAAVRMVNWVHRGTADCRTDAHPTASAGLADDDEIVFLVADCADRRVAEVRDFANFC